MDGDPDMKQFNRPDKQSLLVFFLLLITVCAVCVTVWALFFGMRDTVLTPDHAPALEEHAQPIPGDTARGNDAQPGSGSVSITYSNQVDICLGDRSVKLLFANPGRSNQNVVVELVIQDQIILRSGTITPGNQITELELEPEVAMVLMSGGYDGIFLIHFYDPVSGEKAIVTTEIPVSVWVTK